MGAFLSKNSSNSNSNNSQKILVEEICVETNDITLDLSENITDPRSPSSNINRTPINEIQFREFNNKKNELNEFITSPSTYAAVSKTEENPKNILKSKFSQKLNSKLLIKDPRSPLYNMNRTPIIFSENEQSLRVDNNDDMNKSLDLNDTFSDLFITNDKNLLSSPSSDSDLWKTAFTDYIDPRSPSLELERTPIVFSDDSCDENDMIESYIDALQIDKINSLGKTSKIPVKNNDDDKNIDNKISKNLKKKLKKKNIQNTTNMIYKDEENFSTPKPKKIVQDKKTKENKSVKRTPLSCMANISHLKDRNNFVNFKNF